MCTRGGSRKPLCLQPFLTLFGVQDLTMKVCANCLPMPLQRNQGTKGIKCKVARGLGTF